MTLIVYCTNSSTMIVYQNENQAWHSGNIVATLFIAKSGVNKMLLNSVANYQSIQNHISYSCPTKGDLLFSN